MLIIPIKIKYMIILNIYLLTTIVNLIGICWNKVFLSWKDENNKFTKFKFK